MRRNRLPGYGLHKGTGQATSRFQGKDYYFGAYGTPESRRRYADFIARISAGDKPKVERTPSPLTVAELALEYVRFAETYYIKGGRPTKQLERVERSLAVAVRLYPALRADAFGPSALAAVRDEMVKTGWSRKHVNSCVGCVRRCWRWAAAAELVPAAVYAALQTLDGLRAGRTAARETPPVGPVPEGDLDAALPMMPATIADMVRVQLLSGMRAGEVCAMRAELIDRSGDVWAYAPADHKMSHAGRRRVVLLGPQAQAVLTPRLAEGGFLFSPRRAEAERAAMRRAARRTPVQPSQKDRRAKHPKRTPGEQYTANSYAQAVRRACQAAGVPAFRPHQLRHAAATMLRREFPPDVAQQILGHARFSTTERYAQPSLEQAMDAMRRVG